MADNTEVNAGSGDEIRSLDRLSAGVKTQVVQLDIAGAKTNAESLVSSINPMPAIDAQLHTDVTATNVALALLNTDLGTNHTDMVALHTDLNTTLHTDLVTLNTDIGTSADGSAGTDAGTFSLIALFKRLLQKLTTQLPTALGGHGGLVVEGVASGVAIPVSGTVISKIETDVMSNAGTDLTPLLAPLIASASGPTTIIALTAGKRIRVLKYTIVTNGAVNVKFQSHATPTDLTGLLYFGANGGTNEPFCPVGLFQTVAGEALDINLSGAVAVGGYLVYVLV